MIIKLLETYSPTSDTIAIKIVAGVAQSILSVEK